jgi:hypothetical protein
MLNHFLRFTPTISVLAKGVLSCRMAEPPSSRNENGPQERAGIVDPHRRITVLTHGSTPRLFSPGISAGCLLIRLFRAQSSRGNHRRECASRRGRVYG